MALYLLNVREKCKLPANVLPTIVQEFSDLLCLHLSETSRKLTKILSDSDVDFDERKF